MALGDNIQKYRLICNLSQDALAKRLEVKRSVVSLWEKNAAEPTMEELRKLRDILGVTADQLLGEAEPENMPLNQESMTSVCAGFAYAMGVEPPKYAAPPSETVTSYVDEMFGGEKADPRNGGAQAGHQEHSLAPQLVELLLVALPQMESNHGNNAHADTVKRRVEKTSHIFAHGICFNAGIPEISDELPVENDGHHSICNGIHRFRRPVIHGLPQGFEIHLRAGEMQLFAVPHEKDERNGCADGPGQTGRKRGSANPPFKSG